MGISILSCQDMTCHRDLLCHRWLDLYVFDFIGLGRVHTAIAAKVLKYRYDMKNISFYWMTVENGILVDSVS